MENNLLKDKIKALPLCPGCYLFYNKNGEIIYIGKSKSIKKRVMQHFSGIENKDGKFRNLYREVADIKPTITISETEALILECALIKEYKPKYNVQLLRQKNYPLLKINPTLAYPTISIADSPEDGNCHYFGSFYNRDDAFSIIELMNHIWHTQLCNRDQFQNKRPCLNYHIGRCCAPCNGAVSKSAYRRKISEIIRCLNGDIEKTLERLKNDMIAASNALAFERAGAIKESMSQLEKLKSKSKRLNTRLDGKQMVLFFRAYNETATTLFFIDNGEVLSAMRLDGKSNSNCLHLRCFVQKIKEGKPTAAKHYIAQHLIEIHADKYFLQVDIHMAADKLTEIIIEAYKEYLGL